MIPFLSYWGFGYRREPSKYLLDLHKVCVSLCKKHYGKVYLITDERCVQFFKGIGFDEIIVLSELSDIPRDYGGTWSLGKLMAYRYLAQQKVHFLHLDYDVFLFKKLPDFIEDAGVFAQNIEKNGFKHYGVAVMKRGVKVEPPISKGCRIPRAYNLGIFGGRDFEFIFQYASSSIDMVLHPENREFWTRAGWPPDEFKAMQNATTAEQWFLSCCAEKLKKNVTVLFDSVDRQNCPFEKDAREKGYTHLWGLKDSPGVKKFVRHWLTAEGAVHERV